MPEEPRRAADLLRAYLADRDLPCEARGYNLRGSTDVFCPECGVVIPRPPAEDMHRARMPPADLKLWCPECDYVVTGVNARLCPECAGATLVRFSDERPRRRLNYWLRPRGVPAPIWFNGVMAALAVLLHGSRMVLGASLGRTTPSVESIAALTLGAGIPLFIAAAWAWQRPAIRVWGPHRRQSATWFGFLLGLSWVYALILG